MTITSTVLLNELPDYYMVSLGVTQEAKTVAEGLKQINGRIDGFIEDLSVLGVDDDAYYVDFIAQTKIYDYDLEGNAATQIQTGFEIKKNVIVRLDDLKDFDKLLIAAADQKIYDIIKVEYRNKNVNAIFKRMFKETISITKDKKELYEAETTKKTVGKYRLLADNFYSVSPKTQYKSYQAYESSNVYYTHYNKEKYFRKEARKSSTFYYDGIDVSGFDKILNDEEPTVGLQYIYSLTVIYDLKNK
jgi:uncharacterized protein YggE